MAEDALPPSLQESVLAALVFDTKFGAAIAAQVLPRHFDDVYREIAERVLDYRRQFGRPPGRAHLDDLFARALAEGRTPRLRRILFGLAALAEGLNGEYVLSRTEEFVRQQQLKAALIEANSRFEQGGEGMAVEVESILSGALRYRTQTLDAGTFLNDPGRSLKFLESQAAGISLGIPQFDQMGLTLRPKEMFLYIGPKGSGKSMSCVHVGVQAMMQRQKVLHLSLEWPEERVAARYYQRLFAASTRPDKFQRSTLEFDNLGRLSGFHTRWVTPKWSFSDSEARRELIRKLKPWGTRLGRIVIKYYPSGSLTIQQLEGYLDFLEMQHCFIPTVLIVDYPDLMTQDSKNLRISLGRTFVDLRGIAGKRNLALFIPTQGNRSVLNAKKVRSSDVSEDISKVFTADNVITYQRTPAEKRMGLARLVVEHARDVADGTTIVLTQSYATGQYVLSSAFMQPAYWEALEGDDESGGE